MFWGNIKKNISFSFNEHEKIDFEKVYNISTLRIIFKFVKLEGKKELAALRLYTADNKEINMSDEKSHGKPIPFASRLLKKFCLKPANSGHPLETGFDAGWTRF